VENREAFSTGLHGLRGRRHRLQADRRSPSTRPSRRPPPCATASPPIPGRSPDGPRSVTIDGPRGL